MRDERTRAREDLSAEELEALQQIAEIVERDLVPLLKKLPPGHAYRRFGDAGLGAHRELVARYVGSIAPFAIVAPLALAGDCWLRCNVL